MKTTSKARRGKAPIALAPDGLPESLKWRIVIDWLGLLSGAAVSIGGLLLLQQLGETTLTLGRVLLALAIGLAVGIAVPSLGRAWGVWRANTMLRAARAEREASRRSA